MRERRHTPLLAAALVLALTVAAPCAASTARGVVLIYHHVAGDTPASTSVTPELFADHVRHLDENGFHVMALSALADSLRAGAEVPDRTVVLTFDDGYRSVLDAAVPLLRERNWPFTVFVCPDEIDRRAGPLLTWDQLREVAAAGGEIASHGLRHEFLQRRRGAETDAAWRERVRDELLRSQLRIAAEVGAAPGLLAYPYGEYDPPLQDIVRSLDWAAVGQQSGAVGPLSDLTLLPRFPMAGPYAAMDQFALKASALPLPVREATPASPVLTPAAGEHGFPAPALRLKLQPGDYDPDRLAAYAGPLGRAEVHWIDKDAGLVEIRAAGRLPQGRHRYNVTAPARDGHRHHWYSHLWIVGDEHED